MPAQSPFDKSKAHFIIKRIIRNGRSYAAVYFLADDDASSLVIDEPIAVTMIDSTDYPMAREQFEWLVGGCAAFHDVEVHSFLDNDTEPQIKKPPSAWKTGG